MQSHNSWNLGIKDPQFVSIDPASESFLVPRLTSPAVNAGKDLGDRYYGSAPDLGAYELIE